MTLTVIILTRNEAHHITRALASIAEIAHRTYVIDSGSSDATVALANAAGATVLEHPFVNQAQQFNWALSQLPLDTRWVLRLDADEVVTTELSEEIRRRLPSLANNVSGVYVSRRIAFMRKPIRWGGVFPIRIIRLFRFGQGRSENRWMDEHIIVDGPTVDFEGEILDDNLGTLTAWISKHNSYASREVVDILNKEYGSVLTEIIPGHASSGRQVVLKRLIKENIYARMPRGLRAFLYFIYRWVLRMGFLDGFQGTAFHILQGFWFRYLVDAKLFEVTEYMRLKETDVKTAVRDVLGIDLG